MKKLTAFALTAAMVPALAMGSAAFAQETSDGMQFDENGTDDQGMERARDNDDDRGADESWDDEQGAGKTWGDEQRAGDAQDDDQRAGEQFMSSKPAGALYADDVIGKTVKLRQYDNDLGTIDDLLIGDDGRILGAVITTDGFLGLGGRDLSLGWDHLEHDMEDDDAVFYTDIDEDTLKNAPEHERE